MRRLVELRVRITNRLARHLSDQPEGVLRNRPFELRGWRSNLCGRSGT